MTSEHSFRLASLTFDKLDATAQPTGATTRLDFGTPEALWGYVASFTSPKHRTVCYAHNLSFDLRITNALGLLPEFGFECKGIALNNYSCWARFSDGKRTLWLCDSLSFIPTALDRIASLAKMHKEPLPADDAPDEVWLERCRADVEVTRAAMLRVIRFIHTDNLGDFRLTGSAQASAAFRHRFLRAKSLLIHTDEEALAAERQAAWSGRAEVWRHGTTNEQLHEWDYEFAYTRLAYDLELPTKLIAAHSGIPYKRLERVMSEYAVLADVDVSSEMPLVPTAHNGGIVWPIGRFATTLWDYELRMLADSGATIKVNRYWYYRRAPILKSWAEWMMDKLNADAADVDPIVRVMLKDWSRALIGRFGLRYSTMDEVATLATSDVRLRGMWDVDDAQVRTYLQLGRKLFEQGEKVESPNSTPMVMSAIMSAGRVRLWGAMQHAGEGNVYYCDTDGIIVNDIGSRALQRATRSNALSGLRHKAAYSGGHFRAPRNIDLGTQRRVNGAPRKAERVAESEYRGEVWESLPAALRKGNGTKVNVYERTFHVSDTDRRRIHLPNGVTAPLILPSLDQKESALAA